MQRSRQCSDQICGNWNTDDQNIETLNEATDARLSNLERTIENFEVLLDQLLATEAFKPPTTPERVGESETSYPNAEVWVNMWFAPTFARRPGATMHWCPKWWDHPEAVLRLEALWRTWEVLRRDPTTGIATWLREFFDPQFGILTSADGPFAACVDLDHHLAPELVVQHAPPGHWGTPTLSIVGA